MNDLKFYYSNAVKKGFALGALNFSNMESLQGILAGAKQQNSPAIIAVSEGALEYMGEDYCMALASVARKQKGIFLHLDHGKSFEVCKKAIDLGFDSVMIDGSSLDYEANVLLTKKVASYAHKFGKLVEGELGQLKGVEDNVSSPVNCYTNPLQAKDFVQRTGVDTLAVAIGTSHGAYKYQGEQTLRFDILEEIEKQLPSFPLVLHGASTVEKRLVEIINENGGQLGAAVGIPVELLQEAVKKHNVVKINTDTDLRLAVTARTRETLANEKKVIDPRNYLGKGREEIAKVTEDKIINIFNSSNQL